MPDQPGSEASCAWPNCQFTPAWQVELPGPGLRPRYACTTHLGLVCGDGNPQTALRVTLLAVLTHA